MKGDSTGSSLSLVVAKAEILVMQSALYRMLMLPWQLLRLLLVNRLSFRQAEFSWQPINSSHSSLYIFPWVKQGVVKDNSHYL